MINFKQFNRLDESSLERLATQAAVGLVRYAFRRKPKASQTQQKPPTQSQINAQHKADQQAKSAKWREEARSRPMGAKKTEPHAVMFRDHPKHGPQYKSTGDTPPPSSMVK